MNFENCPIPGARSWSKPSGSGSLRVLILGEALGEAEAHEHRPFVEYAPAGSLLQRAIQRSGFDREQFVMWNVVPVQPPHNYLEGAPYEAAGIEWGRPMLEEVLNDYKPAAILALGNIPLKATTGMAGEYRSISHLQNWVLPSRYGVPVVPSLHPAFLRRGALPLFSVLMHAIKLAVAVATGKPTRFFSPVLWRDFEWTACDLPDLQQPVVPADYLCYPSEQDAWDWFHEAESSGALTAYDIETPRSKEVTENESDELGDTTILSVQFSNRRGSGIFMPWRGAYEEIAKATLALPCAKAGANTWRFDDPLLEAHGCRLNGVRHDVRWTFHHLQPDLKAALQFVSSFWCVGKPGWVPWKHLHASHPEFYGIRDVDAIQEILCA